MRELCNLPSYLVRMVAGDPLKYTHPNRHPRGTALGYARYGAYGAARKRLDAAPAVQYTAVKELSAVNDQDSVISRG